MIFWTPAEIKEQLGLAPELLRDRRRNGLLDGIGALRLPGGRKLTSDPQHPDLNGGEKWVYRPGDVLILALAQMLMGLGLTVEAAIGAAKDFVPMADAWLGDSRGDVLGLRSHRYVALWEGHRTIFSPETAGWPLNGWKTLRLADLNRLSAFTTGPALVVDMSHLGEILPAAFVAAYRARQATGA